MAEPFPSHTITRGGPVSILPRSIRPLDIRFEFRGSTITLDDYLVHTRTTGFLVIKDRTIVAERYFLGADEKSHFTLWSVAKPITSTLVGLAIADGKIKSVDSPVTDYIPELRRSGYEGVPIKDILDMSLGVDFTEDAYDDHPSDVMTMWASDPGRRARTP